MSGKRYLCYSIFVMFMALLSGCVEIVNPPLPKDKSVTLNCILKMDSVQTLRLTYSLGSHAGEAVRNIFSDDYEEVEYKSVADAEITLYENGEQVGKFEQDAFSDWKLNYTPKTGALYRIEAKVPGEKVISATTTFPRPARVTRAREADTPTRKCFDKQATDLFWLYALHKPDDITMYPGRPYISSQFRLYKLIGSDLPTIDHFNEMQDGERLGVEKTYYAYMRVLPDASLRRFYVEPVSSCVVVVLSVSPEYDKYLKSSFSKMLVYKNFEDPTTIFDETEIFSNIENGVGIFGACYERVINCNNLLPE